MKTFAKRTCGAAMALAALLAAPRAGADSLGAMRVGLVQGDVQVKIADTEEWAPASVNMPLVEGDELWVPEGSRAAVQTSDGAHIRLGDDTVLQILRADRGSFQFYLGQGRAYVLTRAPRRNVLQIDTPDASLRAFGAATFQVDVPDGETDVSVFRGTVLAENDAGTTRVRAGRMLALGSDGYAELSPLLPPDEWRRWNAQRDRIVLARGRSSEYLPDELRVYAGDFDEGGRWIHVPEYGYCWTPTVVVIADWAPYRHGRWVWRGGDYVWIGYEPWGWVPYHYGRWTFVARIGWLWVPPLRGEVYWGPGYVGWVRQGDYVAWVPLAPREIYYGYGDYGRYSVNVRTVNVTNIRVTNVYRNATVTGGVTVVNRTTFVTGRSAPVDRRVVESVRGDFARRRNVVAGRPEVKPVGTSYIPVVRHIPEEKRPPAAVRTIDARKLKASRPLVRDPERSALRPQARPRPLEVRRVETPKPIGERGRGVRERQPARVPERREPAAPQGAPPGRVERSEESVPRERGRRDAFPGSSAEPERRNPPPGAPAERGRVERGRQEPGPALPAGRERQDAPSDLRMDRERMERRGGAPQSVPPSSVGPESGPGASGGRGVRPADVAAPETGRPPRPQGEPERERPPRPSRPDRDIERGRLREAPAEAAKPEAPRGESGPTVEGERSQEPPAERGRPEASSDRPDRGVERRDEPQDRPPRVDPQERRGNGRDKPDQASDESSDRDGRGRPERPSGRPERGGLR